MKYYDYIITGAGAAGLMLAYRLAKDSYFDQKSILIIDPIKRISGDRTWSFWENGAGEWDTLVSKSWNSVIFANSDSHLNLSLCPYRYKMIQSEDFYQEVWSVIGSKSNIKFLKQEIVKLIPNNKNVEVHTNKKSFKASKVFNSIPNADNYNKQNKYPVLKQHFVGWFIKTDSCCFNPSNATFMDFDIPQEGNTRFMYVLPLNSKEALVEYTLFSKDLLNYSSYESGIKSYLDLKGITNYEILRKEQGAIPMTSYPFSTHNSSNILNIGTNGGWTKASTGYTFNNCSKKTRDLISHLKRNSDLSMFEKKSRFYFYDMLFLDVLTTKNHLGSMLFSNLFYNVDIKTIFRFLDNSSNFKEDFKIITSFPKKIFIRAIIRRLFCSKAH
tara:strand:- start:245 stop:1399 length:1155 start_codon:yes stop_codon:yes gene_type:complete